MISFSQKAASHYSLNKHSALYFILIALIFVLFKYTPYHRKESGYPIRDFASCPGNRTNILLLQARSNSNISAAGNQPGAWNGIRYPCVTQQNGIQSAPRGIWVCTLPLVEPQVQWGPPTGYLEPLTDSLSTSHPRITPAQQLGLQSPPLTPSLPLTLQVGLHKF